jgi:hypothetical protein
MRKIIRHAVGMKREIGAALVVALQIIIPAIEVRF